jgi:acetoin utilization protein AcuB
MFVGERMRYPVLTIRPEMPVPDALKLMHTEHVRRMPVVGSRGELIGIVTENDLLNASPSEASTLSVWEISYLLNKITIERIMKRNVITATEDMPLEEAARIMADHQIGSLPVLRGGELVGIITETDLFKIFLELLGARESGVRLTVLVTDEPGKLHQLTGAIQSLKGNIIALGTFMGESSTNRMVTMKVGGIDAASLRQAIEPLVDKLVDIRDTVAA